MSYVPEDVFPELRRQTKGCPDITRQDAVIRAAREFCRRSWYVLRIVDIAVTGNVQNYNLVPPGDEEVIGVKFVQVDGKALHPAMPEDQDPSIANTKPSVFTFTPPNVLSLFPIADKNYANGLVLAAVQPILNAETLPREIQQAYHEVIGYGALAWILEMPGETWSNPQMSDLYARKFGAGCSLAKLAAMKSFSPRNLRVDPISFVARTSGGRI